MAKPQDPAPSANSPTPDESSFNDTSAAAPPIANADQSAPRSSEPPPGESPSPGGGEPSFDLSVLSKDQRREKIFYLRKKAREGNATQAELNCILDYETNYRAKQGRKALPVPGMPNPQPSTGVDGGSQPAGDGGTGRPSPEKPKRGPRNAKSPPAVSVASPGAEAGWRAKYGTPDRVGRETVCVTVAGYWHAALVAMAKDLKEAGIEPWINTDAEAIGGTLVLAVDEILPATVAMSHRTKAIGETTALTFQRWWKNKEIKDAASKAKNPKPTTAAAALAQQPPPSAMESAPPGSAEDLAVHGQGTSDLVARSGPEPVVRVVDPEWLERMKEGN